MQQLSDEQIEQGKANFAAAGLGRRDFLKASMAVPAMGAMYFGYESLKGSPVRAGIVGTGNEGCDAMIAQSPPDFLEYIAYHDIRPSQIARGRNAFKKLYGPKRGESVAFYDKYDDMLKDPNVEVIVVATPLWTHADLTIRALQAGKHVFCEKLMAHNVMDAKKMCREARSTDRLLAIGHQRHYSLLYEDAHQTIASGTLGDIRHIRALWHRNNAQRDPATGELRDSWKPAIPAEDASMDAAKFGYKSVEELVRWRLYNRTSGGLMAELGSHQLDACSIFLGKVRPLAVSGIGGKDFFTDDRECEDHIYCTFEFPGNVVVTYSSINTNAMEGYGEIVSGTRGTLMVLRERDALLFEEPDPLKAEREKKALAQKGLAGIKQTTKLAKPGETTMYSAASLGVTQQAKSSGPADVSRGYKEELEHFAWCIRNRDPGNKPRCDGATALGDAVMALTTNVALRTKQRIEFKEAWFDVDSDETPDAVKATA